MNRRIYAAISLAGLLLMFLGIGVEASAQESKTELAKKTQNPVADLITRTIMPIIKQPTLATTNDLTEGERR